MTPAGTVAQCPTHPDRAAETTCVRCGRFVCAQCLTTLRSCPECLPHLVAAQDAMRWPAIATMSGMALTFIAKLVSWPLAWFAPEVLRWQPSSQAHLAGGFYSSVLQISWITSCVLFLIWFHGVVSRTGPVAEVTPGVAVGGFFIPFLNFFLPYVYMRRIARHVKAPGAIVECWWGAFLVASIGSRMIAALSPDIHVYKGSWFSHIDTAAQGGYLLTCALSVVLIFTLERRLQKPLSVGAEQGVR
jgi:hypothetical protein